jgi:hypothetical protein
MNKRKLRTAHESRIAPRFATLIQMKLPTRGFSGREMHFDACWFIFNHMLRTDLGLGCGSKMTNNAQTKE